MAYILDNPRAAVRVTHIPSGITIVCSQHRSQHHNRQEAVRYIRSRLYAEGLSNGSKEDNFDLRVEHTCVNTPEGVMCPEC